jgi:hypothetical protein
MPYTNRWFWSASGASSTTASENYGAWIEGMKRYNKDIAADIL